MNIYLIVTIYIICTIVSLFPFYYVVSHLLYSTNIYLNVLAVGVSCIFALYHFVVFRTGDILLFDVNIYVNSDGGLISVLIPLACAYSYCIPFCIAHRKYYQKGR